MPFAYMRYSSSDNIAETSEILFGACLTSEPDIDRRFLSSRPAGVVDQQFPACGAFRRLGSPLLRFARALARAFVHPRQVSAGAARQPRDAVSVVSRTANAPLSVVEVPTGSDRSSVRPPVFLLAIVHPRWFSGRRVTRIGLVVFPEISQSRLVRRSCRFVSRVSVSLSL